MQRIEQLERIATMHTMSLQQEEGVQETGNDDQDNFGDDLLLQTTQETQGCKVYNLMLYLIKTIIQKAMFRQFVNV